MRTTRAPSERSSVDTEGRGAFIGARASMRGPQLGAMRLDGRRRLGKPAYPKTTVLTIVIALLTATLCHGATFSRCPSGCHSSVARGTCRSDSVCVCKVDWTGLGCETPSSSVVKEKRLDGTEAYVYDTAGSAYDEKDAHSMLYDHAKDVVYVYAQDSNGDAKVIEIDPRYPETFTSSGVTSKGWDRTLGPRRESTNAMPLPIQAVSGFCGLGISPDCTKKHPRAYGHINATLSRGWYGVYAKLGADMTTSSLTSVIVPFNMWDPTTPNQYKFTIQAYRGKQCSSDVSQWESCVLGTANQGLASFTYTKDDYILDAMGTYPFNGMNVYIASHQDGQSSGIVGYVDRNMNEIGIATLSPGLLATNCAQCAQEPDALRMEASVTHFTIIGSQTTVGYIIFAGSALLEQTDSEKIFYPALFKVNSNPASRDGDGVEMYLDNTNIKVLEECEGQFDAKQGRFSTFTAIVAHNGYGYAATSGRDADCPGCAKRTSCIFMFNLDFAEGDGPLAVIPLSSSLGEKDVLGGSVQPKLSSSEKDYIYWTVRSSEEGHSRIVKVEIGGTDTSSLCTSGCFRRVGTHEESFAVVGVSTIASERRLFAVGGGESTHYVKYSTIGMSTIEPKYVSTAASGARVTIFGSGFYSESAVSGLSHNISCRFGHRYSANDGFSQSSWSPATYVSSTELSCEAPPSVDSNSSTIGHAEVQVSFDGFPSDTSDPNSMWVSSLWHSGRLMMRYYDPIVISETKIGTKEAVAFYTGEDADNQPVTLSMFGGPFLNSADLSCKFNGNVASVTSATFVSASEIRCPICTIVGGRCSNPVSSPLPWLSSGQTGVVNVEVSLNGVEYEASVGQLTLHGPPAGVRLMSGPPSHNALTAAPNLALGTFIVGLVDSNGLVIEYDLGQGGTKGYRISAVLSGPSGVSITQATAEATTVDGIATFAPVLDAIPTAGDYTVTFTGADCTDTTCAADLSVLSRAHFSVKPGSAAGLIVNPGLAVESSFISVANSFPVDVVTVQSGSNVSLGYFAVDVVDSGGNQLQTLSTAGVSVTVSLVTGTTDANGDYVLRTTGADLTGTLTQVTSEGRAYFDDLHLVAADNSGSRSVGSTDVINYGEPTRGQLGEASKYVLQFKATVSGSPRITHSIVKIDIGDPVYLRINGTYSDRTIFIESPSQAVGEIIIGAYDGGNNFVGNDDIMTSRQVVAEATSGVSLAGSLTKTKDTSGVWRFADITVNSPTVGDFGLTFSSPDLTSVMQVINMQNGNAGYELVTNISSFSGITAGETVSLDTLLVEIRDMTGTVLGTSDRHSTQDTVAPNRTIQIMSDTLELGGSTSVFTNEIGEVSIADLVVIKPKIGNHTIIVKEISAKVNGVERSGKLVGKALNVVVVVGAVSGFKVQSPTHLTLSSSFTDTIQPSEALAYSAGDTVPIDDFVIVPTDAAGNESPTGTLPSGVTLTVSITGGSAANYPYILGANKTSLARPTSTLAVYSSTVEYPRTGSLTAVTSSTGEATFSGLHLVQPEVGTYDLTFAPTAGSGLTAATVKLEIVPGTSKYIGLPSYCGLLADGVSCDVRNNCTCHRYRSAEKVAVHNLYAYILDGGFNMVGEDESSSCEGCPSRRVHISPQNFTACQNTGDGNACECAGKDALTSELDGKTCSYVEELTIGTLSGLGLFEDVFVMSPKLGSYLVALHSPGLVGVEYHFSVSLGTAVGFVLDQSAASSAFTSSSETAITTASTPLIGRVHDGGGNFLSYASTGSKIFVTCNTATLGEYPQGINPLEGGIDFAISCGSTATCTRQGSSPGVVEFKNIMLTSPTAQTHRINFELNEVVVATYTVTVVLGSASQLTLVNSAPRTYIASQSTELGPFEIAVSDGAGNSLGTSNTQAHEITANITGPRHTFQTTGRDKTIASGADSTLFRDLAISNAEAGNYLLSFSCDSCANLGLTIAPAVFSFTVTAGVAESLLVSTGYTNTLGQTVTFQTAYPSAKEVVLSHVQIRIVDAGSNVVNLNRDVSVSAEPAVPCGLSTNMSYTPQSVVAASAVFDDITFYRPCSGTYSLTFSAAGLASDSVQIQFTSGYPAALDACTVNSLTRLSAGVCEDSTNYVGAQSVYLRDFAVQVVDSSGIHVGSTWNSEARNVTVQLLSFEPAIGQLQLNVTPTMLADWDGSLLAIAGAVGWCNDSDDINPRNVISIDPNTGSYVYTIVYTNSAPSFCREISYSGNAPDTHYNVGLQLRNALAGVYHLQLSSYCPPNRCPNALYATLEADILQFTVVPGTPVALKLITAPPSVTENNFALSPAPLIGVVDAVDNICVQIGANNGTDIMNAIITPQPSSVHEGGIAVPIENGRALFSDLRFSGERGVSYQITFSALLVDPSLSVTSSTPTVVMDCATVRPNSELHEGQCACLPGFTADISGATGYTETFETLYVEENFTLYKNGTTGSTDWLHALQPYGVCIPCKNGFYKSDHGDAECTPCPTFMDTSRFDGTIRDPYNSTSGIELPGALGRTSKESCHCISQTSAPFMSYYRQLPLTDYVCLPCPEGAKCHGNGVNKIETLPGYSRDNSESTDFHACPYSLACLGGVNNTCLDGGYFGKQCAACAQGYAYHAIRDFYPPKCYDCSQGAYAVLNLPIVIANFVWLLGLVFLIRVVNQRRGSQAVSMVKSFLTYLQMTALAKHLDLDWPDLVKGFLLFSEKLSLPDIRSASAKCALNWNFLDNLLFVESLPVGIAMLLFLYYATVKYVEELKEATAKARLEATKQAILARTEDSAEEDPMHEHSVSTSKASNAPTEGLEERWKVNAYDKVLSLAVCFLWIMYPILVQYLIEFTQCTGSAGYRYFVSDYSLRCEGPAYDVATAVVVIGFILYLVGIPYLLFYIARAESLLESHDSVMVQYRLGVLFKGIDVKYAWWWEWLIFSRKLILIITVIVFRRAAVFGGYAVNCLLQFFFLLHIIVKPHVSDEHSKIETYGLLATMATFTSGLIYKQSGKASVLNDVMTAFLLIFHAWTFYVFVRTLMNQFRTDGEDAMINRAIRDLEFENKIVDDYDKKRTEKLKQEEALAREIEEQKLRSLIGQRLPFADDALLETIKRDSTIDMRAEHKELSSKLDDLRDRWKKRTTERSERSIPLDERHLVRSRSARRHLDFGDDKPQERG